MELKITVFSRRNLALNKGQNSGSVIEYYADPNDTEVFMILVNTETIPGYRICEVKGLVQGNTVRAKHFGRDIMAGLKNIVGGELNGYTELLTESRYEATERMIEQARQLGANAVVNVRYATSSIAAGAAELYVYGTAVILADLSTPEPPPLPDIAEPGQAGEPE